MSRKGQNGSFCIFNIFNRLATQILSTVCSEGVALRKPSDVGHTSRPSLIIQQFDG